MARIYYDRPLTIRPRRSPYGSIRELTQGIQIKITLPNGTYKDMYRQWIEDGDCRLWLGPKRDGYAYVTIGDTQISVASLIIRARIKRLIPKDRRIIRTCGRRECVNSEHICLGTQSEAMKLAFARKREARSIGGNDEQAGC